MFRYEPSHNKVFFQNNAFEHSNTLYQILAEFDVGVYGSKPQIHKYAKQDITDAKLIKHQS